MDIHMEDKEVLIVIVTSIVTICTDKERKRRTMWAKTWWMRRDRKGVYNNIIVTMGG